MKRNIQGAIFFLLILMATVFLPAHSQQQYTQVAGRENSYCNSTCTLINVPELNNNRIAVVIATPVIENGYVYLHPIGVHFINDKWSIINLDQQSMPSGSKFTVQYFSRPDPQLQFVHTITSDNLTSNHTRSFIDHAGLNNNPEAQFRFISNGGGNGNNMYDINIQYDNTAGKWYICSIKKKPLDTNIAFNIILDSRYAVAQIPTNIRKDVTPFDSAKAINIQTVPPVINKADMPPVKQPKITATAYDFSHVHTCIDKISVNPLPEKPKPFRIPKIKSNGEIDPVTSITQGLTGVTDKMWSPGDTITVGFNTTQTTSFVIGKVKAFAMMWESVANIKFKFIADVTKAQVKVGFINDNTSWSLVGRDVLNNPMGYQTVNFGWLDQNTADTEFSRVIIHEFGHVLGFIHEHQAPAAGIPWDTTKVIAYFSGTPNNWSREKIDFNIFQTFSKTETNSSAYDRLSIMHYFFPPEFVTDGSMFTYNINLSVTDKQFAKQVYPYPPTQTGLLQTGDDCDEIEFSIEYDVVPKNIIEFTMEPGRDANNNLITWWKKIAIPTIGNGEVGLEMQDGYSVTKSVPVVILDRSKGISFGKAKIAGVHTGLNFKWNAWPAILGGCRVKLKWRRDKC